MRKKSTDPPHRFLFFLDAQSTGDLCVQSEDFSQMHEEILPQQIRLHHFKLERFVYIHANFGKWNA